MCGIAGFVDFNNLANTKIDALSAMTNAMHHRGPDDEGVEVLCQAEPAVLFGHRRLAIIDLSPAGHQPMCDPDTGNWITFNGEIYNYRDLRCELEHCGQIFRSQTDTEVILKAYAAWGTECVRRLRGIFAFGIWDSRDRCLVMVRDQLGVKPLYYWQDGHMLLFASEVRALLASGIVPRCLDVVGLRSYMAYGSVQEPYTLVQNVHSLPPGNMFIGQPGYMHLDRYWQLPPADEVVSIPPMDLFEHMNHLLTAAVSLQKVADVPLGAFLSGGIDSTAITALMQRSASGPVKTFCVVFDENEYDERHFAQIAAQCIGTEHTELLLRGEEVRESLPSVLRAFDQPSIDGLNTYFVSKVTREAGLTVALSGLGGDEIFGGYNGYQKPLLLNQWGQRLRSLPSFVRQGLSEILHFFPTTEKNRRLADLLQTQRHPYLLSRQLFSHRQVTDLLDLEIMQTTQGWDRRIFKRVEQEVQQYDEINQVSAFEIQTYMLNTLLRDTDQMSMAHALEVRVPLLDHVLVEYLFKLPGTHKLDPVHPKPLLTQTLNDLLPEQCVYRQKKGFTLPFAVWLRESLQDEMQSVFTGQSSNGLPFSTAGMARLWTAFEQGQVGWGRIWSLFILRNWLIQHGMTI